MKIKPGEEGFWKSFESCPVTDEWQGVLYNYIIHGLHPGSFFTAVLSNDLMWAAQSSHIFNDWNSIRALCTWLLHEAPIGSWGDEDAVIKWIALSEEERLKICVDHNFVLTEEELTWHILELGQDG